MRAPWRIAAATLALCLGAAVAGADFNPFTRVSTMTVAGSFVAGGTCIGDNAAGGPDGGTIDLQGLPPGASVVAAWLYYTVLDAATPVSMGSPRLDGVPLSPVRIGPDVPRSPCFEGRGLLVTGAFRADVSAVVGGNGAYTLSGFPSGGALTEGATIVAVYCRSGEPARDIVIYEGVDVVNDGVTQHSQLLLGFAATATGPVTADWLFIAGNGQETSATDTDPLSFNATPIETLVATTQVLGGSACAGPASPPPDNGLWDLGRYAVGGQINPGDTSAMATLDYGPELDCYTVAAHVLAVDSDRAPGVCVGCPATPGRVARLLGRKALPGDAELSWDPEPLSAGGYNLYGVGSKASIPSATGFPPPACSAAPGNTRCTVAGALGNPPALVFYQVVGVCSDGVTEGPI